MDRLENEDLEENGGVWSGFWFD